MIPETIDPLKLIAELNAAGWRDYKIEIACDLPVGYISNVKSRKVRNPRYEHAAALLNFHAQNVPHETVNNQTDVVACARITGVTFVAGVGLARPKES